MHNKVRCLRLLDVQLIIIRAYVMQIYLAWNDRFKIKDDTNKDDKTIMFSCTMMILYDSDSKSSILLKSSLNSMTGYLSLQSGI